MDEAYGTYAADDEQLDNHDYDDDTDDDKAWRRRDLLLAGQPASQPAGRLAALPALGLPHGPLSGPDRASYGVWRDVIWIKLKLSARSTRLDGSQHPDIVSNGRL